MASLKRKCIRAYVPSETYARLVHLSGSKERTLSSLLGEIVRTYLTTQTFDGDVPSAIATRK